MSLRAGYDDPQLSRTKKIAPRKESGLRNLGNFCLWNTESWASGITLKESGSHQRLASGIQVPRTNNSISSTWNPESTA